MIYTQTNMNKMSEQIQKYQFFLFFFFYDFILTISYFFRTTYLSIYLLSYSITSAQNIVILIDYLTANRYFCSQDNPYLPIYVLFSLYCSMSRQLIQLTNADINSFLTYFLLKFILFSLKSTQLLIHWVYSQDEFLIQMPIYALQQRHYTFPISINQKEAKWINNKRMLMLLLIERYKEIVCMSLLGIGDK